MIWGKKTDLSINQNILPAVTKQKGLLIEPNFIYEYPSRPEFS